MELRSREGNGEVVLGNNTMEFQSTNQLTAEQLTKSEEALGPYNPFEHRVVAKPTTDYGALAHLLKSSLGSGILAMPLAIAHGGLTFGLIGTLIVGYICTHCVQMLVDSSHVLCRRARIPMLGFAETAECAFTHGPAMFHRYARSASLFSKGALCLAYLTGNAVYVVIVSRTVQQIVENLDPSFNIDIRLYILMLYLPLLILCLVKDLKYLVPFSIIANICIVVVFGLTLYYMFDSIPDPATRNQVAPVDKIPLFFATVIFAMEGIGVVMPVENSMKTPQHFTGCPGVLNIAMGVVVSLYAIIGFFGYLKYGEATQGTVTLNILQSNPDDAAAQTVQYLIAIAIFFTYALQFYVPTSIIWDNIKDRFDEKRHFIYEYIMRFVLVTGTVVLAIAVPNLGPIISLVGAVCFSILGLLLPSVIDTVTRWEEGFGWANWILYKNCIIGILSILALISGSYASILEIIDTY